MIHEVSFSRRDGRMRLVCNSEGCESATLVRRVGMSDNEWMSERAKFLRVHPCPDACVQMEW